MTSMKRGWSTMLAALCVAAAFLPAPVGAQTTPATSPTPRSLQRDIELSRYAWRPIVRIGQDYTLRADDAVRDIQVISGNARIEGRVFGDVVVVFGDVHVASTAAINGTVVAVAGSVTIDNGASIGRDMVVVGGTVDAPPAFSPRGDHVVIGMPELGQRLRGIVPWLTYGLLWGRPIVPNLGWVWMVVLIFFGMSLVLNLVFDRAARSCATITMERPLNALLAGLVTLILLGPIFVIMAATVVGILVIPFFACVVAVAWMLGKVGVVRGLGASIVHQSDPLSRAEGARSFVIGFVLLVLAYMVPIVGLIIWALVGVLGLGAGTMTFLAALRRESPKKATPPSAPATPPPPASPMPMPPSPSIYDAPGASAPMASAVAAEPAAYAPPPIEALPQEPAEPDVAAPAAVAGSAAAVVARPYATFLDRIAAFALDCILVAIANNLFDFARAGGPFLLFLLIYHVAFWAWMGTTMGGIIVGVRVVKTTGEKIRIPDALVRGLGSIFSVAALCIGCLWMLQDPERQMWHDKIAGTHVVKVPRNLMLA